MEIDRFGTAALPFYVVLSPDDEEISRFPGMDPDANKFIDFLEKSLN
jgi:thiol:disulfide interchange protein DsbD